VCSEEHSATHPAVSLDQAMRRLPISSAMNHALPRVGMTLDLATAWRASIADRLLRKSYSRELLGHHPFHKSHLLMVGMEGPGFIYLECVWAGPDAHARGRPTSPAHALLWL